MPGTAKVGHAKANDDLIHLPEETLHDFDPQGRVPGAHIAFGFQAQLKAARHWKQHGEQ